MGIIAPRDGANARIANTIVNSARLPFSFDERIPISTPRLVGIIE
jgi:hypothetical protein